MTAKERVIWFANTWAGAIIIAIIGLAIIIGLNMLLVKGKVF
jgi:hypothetical protein